MDANENYWHSNYTQVFDSILAKHESQIILVAAAHLHRAEFSADLASGNRRLDIPFIITP